MNRKRVQRLMGLLASTVPDLHRIYFRGSCGGAFSAASDGRTAFGTIGSDHSFRPRAG
jgi:hypothetical protein